MYKDHSTAMLCKSPKIAKEMQPSFEINEGGIRTEKDIYLSQTHYAHHYFSPVIFISYIKRLFFVQIDCPLLIKKFFLLLLL